MSLSEYISFVKKLVESNSYTYTEGFELIRLRKYSDFHALNKLNADISDSTTGKDIIILELATHYQDGLNIKRDTLKAFNMLKSFPQTARIINALAYCHENALGVTKNVEEAFNLYQIAAGMGDCFAKVNLIRCYINRIGTKQDIDKAINLSKKLLLDGHFVAYNLLGMAYNTKDGSIAVDMFHLGVEFGDPTSVLQYSGLIYWSSRIESFEILKKYEKFNYQPIIVELANRYRNGSGTNYDLHKAIDLYIEAMSLRYDVGLICNLQALYKDASADQKIKIITLLLLIIGDVYNNSTEEQYAKSFLNDIVKVDKKEVE